MKKIHILREELIGGVFSNSEIDSILEDEKYLPIECDEELENGILKYSNGKSQIWVKYIRENEEYLISHVTMKTKKSGKTETHAFRNVDDIKNMMDYFRNNNRYEDFLTFVLGLFLARRIGDTLSLKWSDFYYENGRKKETLNSLIEQKTDKIIDIHITDITWKYIDWYCEKKNINPMEHFLEDVIPSKRKDALPADHSAKEYWDAIEKQESDYRYRFKKAANYYGIKGVSTHSTRKTFVYIAHQLNKFDPDNWEVLKTITGHENIETLKRYSDIMNEKGQKMYADVGKYIEDIDNGIKPGFENMLVIALRTKDLREILYKAYRTGQENPDGKNDIEIMNQLIQLVEDKCVN